MANHHVGGVYCLPTGVEVWLDCWVRCNDYPGQDWADATVEILATDDSAGRDVPLTSTDVVNIEQYCRKEAEENYDGAPEVADYDCSTVEERYEMASRWKREND